MKCPVCKGKGWSPGPGGQIVGMEPKYKCLPCAGSGWENPLAEINALKQAARMLLDSLLCTCKVAKKHVVVRHDLKCPRNAYGFDALEKLL